MKPFQSDMPHTGRGVQATRSLATGDIVLPVPVLPIRRKSIEPTNQLWINYCFSHPLRFGRMRQ